MGIGREFVELMEKIGYTFNDVNCLQIALTHSSYTNEMKKRGFRAESNEAYEFLGDAILQMVISEELFDRYRKDGEGALSRLRQILVCESMLADIARRLDVGKYLNVGTGEEATDVRNSNKVLADAMEAIIAAVYIDSRATGSVDYRRVILNLFEGAFESAAAKGTTDYKTALQQFVEKNPDSELRYGYSECGPAHEKTFTATAYINNNKVGEGRGKTKRSAETEAARCALKLFGIIGDTE